MTRRQLAGVLLGLGGFLALVVVLLMLRPDVEPVQGTLKLAD